MRGGIQSVLPRASREQVLAAVSACEGAGPVTIGHIAEGVAGELGVDLRFVDGAYDLRKLISWGGLQKDVKGLVDAGLLVRRTEEDWHRITRGLLFPGKPSATTWAYCTPTGAQAVRELAQGEGSLMRRELAEQYAVRALAARHPAEYAALVQAWLNDNPARSRGQGGG